MLAVSNAFNEAFKQDYRDIKMRVKIKDVTYTDSDIISFNYNSGSIVGESFAIGSTFANTMKLTLCKIVEGLKQLDEVIPEMGIVVPSGSIEWVKLGTFIISEQVNPDRNENRTSIECTDKMIMLDDPFESKLPYPAKIKDVALEIANLSGVAVDKTSFSRITESKIQKPIGYTYRQALGLIAQFEAGYAKFDRNGLLAIERLVDKNYEVTPNEYFQKGLVKNELLFRPSGIQVRVSDDSEKIMSVGNSKGSVINLENKVMTKALLDEIYLKVKDINYYPYSLNWRGNPAVEVGDWLQVTDTKGNRFKVPNLSYSLDYKGGLTATSTVETVASNEVRFGYKKILDQVIEHVDNAIKDIDGNVIYYGVEEPPNPKEGDTWFKYVDSDTEIWVYEKVGEPDKFDWVFKISSAVDNSIKEAITDLEQISKENTEKVDQALLDAESARNEAKTAREEAFNSGIIAKNAEKDALNALAKGDSNTTKITSLEGQQKLTNTKVEGNTASILSLQTDSEKLSLSIGKVEADVDGIQIGATNLVKSSDKPIQSSQYRIGDYYLYEDWIEGVTYTLLVSADLEEDRRLGVWRDFGSTAITTNVPRRSDGLYSITFKCPKHYPGTDKNLISFYNIPSTSTSFGRVNWVMLVKGNKVVSHQIAPQELNTKSEFATFEANYQGFQFDVKNDLNGLHSQKTIMDGQINSVIEKVDNLEIEGRNLFIQSEFNKLKVEQWIVPAYVYRFKLLPNTHYTLTSNVPAYPDDTAKTSLYFNGSLTVNDGVWRDKVVSKTSDSEGNLFIAVPANRIHTEDLRKGKYWVKFEKGKKATDWSPAPEDNASKSEVIQLSDQNTQTVNKVETVDGKVNTHQTQITQLSSQIDLKVGINEVISKINLSPEQILIKSKLIHLAGDTLIDSAVIKNAHIANGAVDTLKIKDASVTNAKILEIDAGKIVTGFLDANRIKGKSILADHLAANTIELALEEMGRAVKITPMNIKIFNTNSEVEFMRLDTFGLQVARTEGNKLGIIGRNNKPGYPDVQGLTFGLEHRGQFMSWTAKYAIDDPYYTDQMILDPRGAYAGVSGLHLETRFRPKKGGTVTGNDWQWYVDSNYNKHTIAYARLANGYIAEDFYFERGNSLQSYRNIHMNGYNVTGSSSYSLKENFEYMNERDSLNAILSTDIVGYNYIENPDAFNVGFVINDNGQSPYYTDERLIRSKKYKDDSLLVGHLMLAVKALNEKIEILEERIEYAR